MAGDSSSVGDLLAQMVKEGKRRILMLVAVFTVVALVGLVFIIFRPKMYECGATLLVTSSSFLSSPTSPTKSTDPALITQLVLSRNFLRELLSVGGWTGLEDPRMADRKLKELRMRIRIRNSRPELIRISYTDTDPERCFRVTNKLVEIYIREAVAPTERETRKAVEILDRQVAEYGAKLSNAHEQVLAHYRSREVGSTPSLPDDPSQPRNPPPSRGQNPPALPVAELTTLRAEEATLIAELRRQEGGPRTPTPGRDELRYNERTMQLQAELDRLLTTYTEEHPDVKRARRELERIRTAEIKARADREDAERTATALDKEMAQATRARLEEVQRRIAAIEGGGRRPRPDRPSDPTPIPTPAVDPEMVLINRDSVMTELLRQYETTREIYQDLLKRRENARVSLQLAEETGLGLKVQEEAEMPLTAISTRLLYLVAAAIFLAGLAPLGVLFGLVRLDSRLRTSKEIQTRALVPFLVGIPYVPQYRDRVRSRRRVALAFLMLVSVFAAYLIFFIMRMKASS